MKGNILKFAIINYKDERSLLNIKDIIKQLEEEIQNNLLEQLYQDYLIQQAEWESELGT